VPATVSQGKNLNVQPVKPPLFVDAQLAFVAVVVLAVYDDPRRKPILAHHTARCCEATAGTYAANEKGPAGDADRALMVRRLNQRTHREMRANRFSQRICRRISLAASPA
jgi:hypothetical protein